MQRYSYICEIETNWVCVQETLILDWMTKEMFDNKSYDEDFIQQEVIQELGLDWEVVDDNPDELATLRTSLAAIGCDTEEELYDTVDEAMGQDYEEEAIMHQGISWEIKEIDSLKDIRKAKLRLLNKV